jgi:hypothetical protein
LIAQNPCATKRDQIGRAWSRKFCRCREIELETGGGPGRENHRRWIRILFPPQPRKNHNATTPTSMQSAARYADIIDGSIIKNNCNFSLADGMRETRHHRSSLDRSSRIIID